MSTELNQLIRQLTLEKQDENIFTGNSLDIFRTGRVFGGQVLGQSLSAATYTIPEGREVHSMHAYFVRPGDTNKNIVYEIQRTRDGRSFSVRHVAAKQDGKTIFHMSCSFQIHEEGFDHADGPAEDFLPPEDSPTEEEMRKMLDLPPPSRPHSVELRFANPDQLLNNHTTPDLWLWFKANGEVPDETLIQKSILAYASDFFLLVAALRPHGVTPFTEQVQLASLDHALWFHRKVNVNDWILYQMHSPNAINARGLTLGKFFDRSGKLIASSAQEGLTRVPSPKS